MLHCLYYSFEFNESKEKLKVVFCWFSAIKNIGTPLSSSNLNKNRETLVFLCLDKSLPMGL